MKVRRLAVFFLIVCAALVFAVYHAKIGVPGKESPRRSLPLATRSDQQQTSVSPAELNSSTWKALSRVRKFVFFIGYERSGHSIIGALMDAHPHVIMAHQFFLFSKFHELDESPVKTWKNDLFEKLYRKSVEDTSTVRKDSKKGYTLEIPGLWQGRFEDYVEVIGDKSGGRTTQIYLDDKTKFVENYRKLKKRLSIPVLVVHAVRNPFDIISTKVLFNLSATYGKVKHFFLHGVAGLPKLNMPEYELTRCIKWFFTKMAAVDEMIEQVFGRENVLEVHNCDLVGNPKVTISRIFQFVGVDTTEEFLDTCAAKVFKSISRSRDIPNWTPGYIKMVENEMKKYRVLSRYSFAGD